VQGVYFQEQASYRRFRISQTEKNRHHWGSMFYFPRKRQKKNGGGLATLNEGGKERRVKTKTILSGLRGVSKPGSLGGQKLPLREKKRIGPGWGRARGDEILRTSEEKRKGNRREMMIAAQRLSG